MKHNLTDVNSYLFEQLDALSNPDLAEEELETEINRSEQITAVSKTIIDKRRLMLDGQIMLMNGTENLAKNYLIY